MIHYLLLFQFALLYWIAVVLGLIVYGSDFDVLTGKLYLMPVVVVPLLHRFHPRFAQHITRPIPATTILLIGALLAWLAYQPMHFAYWDEHNLRQAVLLSVLAVFSYLAAVIGAVRLQHWQGNHAHAVVIAWLVLGIVCLPAVAYPMISILMMALILAVASVWHVRVKADTSVIKQDIPFNSTVLKYLIFLLALDFSLTLWDYQVDSRWAWHLALLFVTAALGSRLVFTTQLKFYWLVVVIVVVNFIVTIVWPGYVIHPLHSALIGLCLGWVTGFMLQSQLRMNPFTILSVSFPMVLGLVLGHLFYANLAYVVWRALLLVPLPALILRSRTNVAKSATGK